MPRGHVQCRGAAFADAAEIESKLGHESHVVLSIRGGSAHEYLVIFRSHGGEHVRMTADDFASCVRVAVSASADKFIRGSYRVDIRAVREHHFCGDSISQSHGHQKRSLPVVSRTVRISAVD